MSDALREAIMKNSRQSAGVHVLFWGTAEAIETLLSGPVSEWLGQQRTMKGYTTKIIDVYLPYDRKPSDKPKGYDCCTRKILILSPGMPGNCYPYMVSLTGWSPALFGHVIGLLKLAGEPLAITPPSASN
jgi:hypothetical protein